MNWEPKIVLSLMCSAATYLILLGCGQANDGQSVDPSESSIERSDSKQPAPGGSRAVTTSRLLRNKLKSIRRGEELVWTFSDTGFVVENGKKSLPAEVAMVITGQRSSTSRIDGRWRLDKNNTILVLTEIKSNGKKTGREVRLPINPAGLIRINLGNRQYNTFPVRKKTP